MESLMPKYCESAFPRVLAEIQTIRSKTQYAFRQVLPNARNVLPKYWRFRNIAGQIGKAGFPPSTGICDIHRVQECLSRAGGLLMRGALPSVLLVRGNLALPPSKAGLQVALPNTCVEFTREQ